MKAFFDSNVLIYLLTRDDVRAGISESLLSNSGTISVQVLNEFASVARRKFGRPWDEIEIRLSEIQMLCKPVRTLTLVTHKSALGIAQRYQVNIYDALMIASALEAGCDVLYSEDMQHNQRIGGLTIINPFLSK